MRNFLSLAFVSIGTLAFATACEQSDGPPTSAGNRSNAPDVTAVDQSESSPSIKITSDIRRAIMDDETMSISAQNCLIVTDEKGMVTLRGVVDSQAEKDSIDAKARTIAGSTNVDNQLTLKPD